MLKARFAIYFTGYCVPYISCLSCIVLLLQTLAFPLEKPAANDFGANIELVDKTAINAADPLHFFGNGELGVS